MLGGVARTQMNIRQYIEKMLGDVARPHENIRQDSVNKLGDVARTQGNTRQNTGWRSAHTEKHSTRFSENAR